MLEVNQILQKGRYRILEQAGNGLSYQAYDNFLKANVALQEINEKGLLQDKCELDYAKRAKNLTQIKHDSLLNIHDYFSEIDRQYLVSESVEGDSMSGIIERSKSLINLADFVRWSDQLLDAVSCLQNRIPPIIHSEIRPQNIKLTANNKLKLITFSFSKQNEQNPDSTELPFFPLERIWKNLDSSSKQFILRSYDEKSERILAQPLDVRSDVYSVGATLYYLATGKRPIDVLERTINLLEGKADPLQPLNKLNPAIPLEIASIVMKALEIKREDRFSSALVMQSIFRGTVIRLKPYVGEHVVASLKANSVEREKLQVIQPQEVKPIEIVINETPIEEPKLLELIEKEPVFKVEPPPIEEQKTTENTEKTSEETAKNEVEEIVKPEVESVLEKVEIPSEEVREEVASPLEEPDLEAGYVSETDNWDEAFAVPKKQNNGFYRIAALAVGLVVLGGIGFGIWKMNSFDSALPSQSIPTQNVVLPTETATPITTIESEPAPIVAPTPEISPSVNPVESTVAEKPTSQRPAKNKSAVTAPSPVKVKKSAENPKPSAAPKKITVDDLINDR